MCTLFSIPTIEQLKNAGLKGAVCSNLAAPYAVPAKLLLGAFDGYAWSYELGAIKLEVEIYQHVLGRLDCIAENVAMVGDTLEADVLGPARLGMAGFHLVRDGTPGPRQLTGLREFAARLLEDLHTA